ncbi:MAG: DUF2642 domain-containing protein [Anaerolineae bacterium]|nr:DUF2642 domain-containing protein [Anaerolineae bacterium]
MFVQRLNQLVGEKIILTTLTQTRIQGIIREVGPDYVLLTQEGAPRLRLVPIHAIDNVDFAAPQSASRPQPPQGRERGRR